MPKIRSSSIPAITGGAMFLLISPLFANDAPLTPPEITEQAISILDQSISFQSVEGGDETIPLANFLASQLRQGGFANEDIQVETHGKSATLIATYRGTGTKKPMLLSAHMDVVGADPADWTRDPFSMVREDGYLFGRGASDNKFGVSMLITTLIRLKNENFVSSRDVILVLSGDEETQMKTTQFLAEKFEGVDFVLNSDGGGGGIDEGNDPVAYYLQAAEKTYADYEITFTNPGGHSSTPREDNAIYNLAEAASKIAAFKFPVQLNEITSEFFRATGKNTDGALGKAMLRFAANPKDKKAAQEIASHPEFVGQLGTTCVATMLDAGHALNALPQRASMNVNCRIFPGVNPSDVQSMLTKVIDNPDAMISVVDEIHYSDGSPLRADVTAALRKAVDRRYPGLTIVPEMSAGASDSLHFRAHGIDSYGVSGIFMKTSDSFAHGLNERVPEATIDGALDHWHTLITELAGNSAD